MGRLYLACPYCHKVSQRLSQHLDKEVVGRPCKEAIQREGKTIKAVVADAKLKAEQLTKNQRIPEDRLLPYHNYDEATKTALRNCLQHLGIIVIPETPAQRGRRAPARRPDAIAAPGRVPAAPAAPAAPQTAEESTSEDTSGDDSPGRPPAQSTAAPPRSAEKTWLNPGGLPPAPKRRRTSAPPQPQLTAQRDSSTSSSGSSNNNSSSEEETAFLLEPPQPSRHPAVRNIPASPASLRHMRREERFQ